MLSEEEYIEQQRSMGLRIHRHRGIWWEEVFPFYCKPAFVYTAIDPGEARPKRIRSLLGYSHQVRDSRLKNRTLCLMVLEGAGLNNFCLATLGSKKRNNVRRGLKTCVVKRLRNIEPHLQRMREINIAQAIRQEQKAGSETPVSRYQNEANSWRRQIVSEFALEGREWWGAFVNGMVVAYLRTYQVNGIRVIQQTKIDTASLRSYAMDALYFTVLSRAAEDPDCNRVINGPPLHESLNKYKEQFQFCPVEIPYYSSNHRLVEVYKMLLSRFKK
jgi:hypothetical protein